MNRIVSFRQMKDGTREDYLLLEEYERDYVRLLPQRVLTSLLKLGNSFEGYPVSRLEHSLQCASRAHADGADEDLVVGALIHDIGDELSPYNHAEIAAGILRPYVRARSDLDRRAARRVPELLLRAPHRRRSQRAGAASRPSVVRGLRRFCRALGSVLV